MKMHTLRISLPASMAEFVRRQAEKDYANVSEFFRDLVREKVQREIDADLALLESTNACVEPGPREKEIEEVLTLQKKLRKSRRTRCV